MLNKAKIIFIGNYKGGVGKTTSVLNLATYFSKKSKKVLVMDLDPQSSLSEILCSNNNTILKEIPDKETLNYIFDLSIIKVKKYKSINLEFSNSITKHYQKAEFDFIVSSLYYKNGGLDDLVVKMEDTLEYLSILKNYIDKISINYDYIFIDCPPSSNLITKSMFLMSDYYIIPTILDKVSSNGVAHYIKTVNKTYNHYCEEIEDSLLAKHYFGDKPKLIGVFITFIRAQVDYASSLKNLEDTLLQEFSMDKNIILDERINNYIDIARSTELGDVSKGRKDYERLSEEILKRL